MSQLVGDKSSLNGAWSGSHDAFKKFTRPEVSLEWLKLELSNFVWL